MAPANRKTLAKHSARDRHLRKGIPTLAEMAPIFAISEEAAAGYLLTHNVLTVPTCTPCGRQCIRRGTIWKYCCQRHKYTASLVSLTGLIILTDLSKILTSGKFADLLFSQCKFGVHLALLILYSFATEDSWSQIILKTGLSQRTVTNWLRYC